MFLFIIHLRILVICDMYRIFYLLFYLVYLLTIIKDWLKKRMISWLRTIFSLGLLIWQMGILRSGRKCLGIIDDRQLEPTWNLLVCLWSYLRLLWPFIGILIFIIQKNLVYLVRMWLHIMELINRYNFISILLMMLVFVLKILDFFVFVILPIKP